MHDHRLAPAEGATLADPAGSIAALRLTFEPVGAGRPALATGLAAIGAWARSALCGAEPPAGSPPKRAPLAVRVRSALCGAEPPASSPPERAPLAAPRADARERPPVIGYVLYDGGDLADAARAIGVWCEAHGWPLARVIHDARGGRRPGLEHALDELRARHAAGLVVARLRDLADTVTELGPLLRWFAEGDAFVIALDYELDTSSEPGEFGAGALVAISDWERDRVEGRTRPGPDAARRAVRDDPALSALIAAMRDEGMSLQAIADALNHGEVPTLHGGTRWRPSSVQAAGYVRPQQRAEGEG